MGRKTGVKKTSSSSSSPSPFLHPPTEIFRGAKSVAGKIGDRRNEEEAWPRFRSGEKDVSLGGEESLKCHAQAEGKVSEGKWGLLVVVSGTARSKRARKRERM